MLSLHPAAHVGVPFDNPHAIQEEIAVVFRKQAIVLKIPSIWAASRPIGYRVGLVIVDPHARLELNSR
jgi:hypothetical protein